VYGQKVGQCHTIRQVSGRKLFLGDHFLVQRFVPGDHFLVLRFIPGNHFLVLSFVPGDLFLVLSFVPGDHFLVPTITRLFEKNAFLRVK
jgi:hypothetical protein